MEEQNKCSPHEGYSYSQFNYHILCFMQAVSLYIQLASNSDMFYNKTRI